MADIKILDLFNTNETIAKELLLSYEYPWEVLPLIKDFILKCGNNLSLDEYEKKDECIWVHKSAKLYPNCYIAGPCIIGANTEVRPGAFIRGNALVGENCVVGNSTELKNVILFNNVQVPHYNYVGDSILGYKAHMGAGSITSNVKSDKALVVVHNEGMNIPTGLKKFGAMLGDNVEVGCNSVLNPGTIIGKSSNVYPTSCVRGVVPALSIHKNDGTVIKKN